jgi:hypothetical protein
MTANSRYMPIPLVMSHDDELSALLYRLCKSHTKAADRVRSRRGAARGRLAAGRSRRQAGYARDGLGPPGTSLVLRNPMRRFVGDAVLSEPGSSEARASGTSGCRPLRRDSLRRDFQRRLTGGFEARRGLPDGVAGPASRIIAGSHAALSMRFTGRTLSAGRCGGGGAGPHGAPRRHASCNSVGGVFQAHRAFGEQGRPSR